MADLTIDLCGLRLRNPLILASGPLSHDGAALLRAHQAGLGAVVTKTIHQDAARNPLPHILSLRSGLLNSERWSDLPARTWIEHEIPLAKEGGAVVIASLGPNSRQVNALARPLADAGADALEVCSYDASDAAAMVTAAVRNVQIPVLVKVSANWDDVVSVASACLRAGARGITAIDSVGPALRLDIHRRAPLLGDGFGWLSGPPILPISLRVVADLARATGAEIVGTGGIGSADDGIEMMMAGARAIGICSHLMIAGLGVVGRWLEAMKNRLDELGYARAGEAIGAALPALAHSLADPDLVPVGEKRGRVEQLFYWNRGVCTGCGRCVQVCPYEARVDPDHVKPDRCRACGLCVSVCPVRALSLCSPDGQGDPRERGRWLHAA